MNKKPFSLLILLLLSSFSAFAQWPFNKEEKEKKDRLKLYQNSRGIILGYERGSTDMIRFGYQYNWKKVRLQKPVIRAAEGYLELAPFTGVLGGKLAYWQRIGRLKFTYGAQAGAVTDFSESSLSLGPTLGFRLLSFHGQLGYNILSNEAVEANRLFVSITAFIPLHSKLSSRKGDKEKTILKW